MQKLSSPSLASWILILRGPTRHALHLNQHQHEEEEIQIQLVHSKFSHFYSVFGLNNNNHNNNDSNNDQQVIGGSEVLINKVHQTEEETEGKSDETTDENNEVNQSKCVSLLSSDVDIINASDVAPLTQNQRSQSNDNDSGSVCGGGGRKEDSLLSMSISLAESGCPWITVRGSFNQPLWSTFRGSLLSYLSDHPGAGFLQVHAVLNILTVQQSLLLLSKLEKQEGVIYSTQQLTPSVSLTLTSPFDDCSDSAQGQGLWNKRKKLLKQHASTTNRTTVNRASDCYNRNYFIRLL